MTLVTSPSSERALWRPSRRVIAPRPHSATIPPAALPPATAKDVPVIRSRSVTARERKPATPSSPSAPRSRAGNVALSGENPPPTCSPATRTSTPGRGASLRRRATASMTCAATVRPKRASHAFGIGSSFSIVPVPVPSAMRAFSDGLESVSVSVSEPSS